ncbi:MAG: hypothetical protein L3J98_05240 [Gammaproteobacteria bacterium]|nr:hypothetical protein [Gammaproteobacteria bacterium]MCF6259555.1 hypothetical protein [Gammaproteobacteria bacterium]
MDKVNVLFVMITLIITSCTYTKGMAVVNTTDQPIEVTIIFSNSDISPINFIVSGNSDDVLMYDVDSRSNDLLSMGLNKIILDNKSCITHIPRGDIEKKIKTNGLWKLIVDDKILDCHITN